MVHAALQADGEYEVRVYGLKHQKEKRSMDHFAGLDVSVKRLHRNVLAIALANKLARIAWSVLANGRIFEARLQAA